MPKKAARKAANRGAQIAKNRHKHKVVLPNGSKEKGKQLHSVITFKAEPPPGYTFIPAGNPELTAALKEFSRQGDHKIFAVTTTPHAARHELSREVHRIGFHFPTQVVAQVCNYYGIRLTSGGKVIDESKDDQLFSRVYQRGERPKLEDAKDQVTINTEAKQTIKDLFPNIPDKDLFQIIKTAFQLGDGRVGTAEEIPLVRRAQLSVVAHIRHVYTDYDRLLRRVPYNDARHAVEEATLAMLVGWRGDDDQADEATKHAAAEALREVIVISDEDDSDSQDDYEPIAHDDLRVEELATSAYAPGPGRQASPDPSVGYPGHFRRVDPLEVRRYRPTQDEIAQRDLSRYAVWDQAKQNYRASTVQNAPVVLERIYEPEVNPRSRVLIPLDPPIHPSGQPFRSQQSTNALSRIDYEPRPTRAPSPPSYIRGPNGVLYERVVTRTREYLPDIVQQHYDSTGPIQHPTTSLVRTRPSSPLEPPYRGPQQSGNFEEVDGTIIPSIEGNDVVPLSPRVRRNPFARLSEPRNLHDQQRNVREYAQDDLSAGANYTYQNRWVEDIDRVQLVQDYHAAREASPVRHGEPLYRSRGHPSHTRPELRAVAYDAPPLSPRSRPEKLAGHHLVHDTRELPYTSAGIHRAALAMDEVREVSRHPQFAAQDHGYRHQVPLSADMQRFAVEQAPPKYGAGAHEGLPEVRHHDNRVARSRNTAGADQFMQPLHSESRIRPTYPPATVVREPLEDLPSRRVAESDYPVTAVRPYALPSRY